MYLRSVHLAAMSTECCRTDSLFLWHISDSVLSSRSYMYTRTHLGPSNVPCGTPPLKRPCIEFGVVRIDSAMVVCMCAYTRR